MLVMTFELISLGREDVFFLMHLNLDIFVQSLISLKYDIFYIKKIVSQWYIHIINLYSLMSKRL